MPKISVIVPLHNSTSYLDELLSSIKSQTFADYELLLMENGSSDDTYERAKEFAEKDSRIKVFTLSGKGICYARNCGIDEAKGDYITLLDHDDMISNDLFEALYSTVENGKADIGLAPVSLYFSADKVEKINYKLPARDEAYSGVDKALLFSERFIWSRIYSRKLLEDNNIRFNSEVEAVEDWVFFTEALLLSDSVGVADKGMYYYRLDRATQASRGVSYSKSKKEFKAYELIRDLLNKHDITRSYSKYYDYELARDILGKSFALTPFKNLNRQQVEELTEPLKDELLAIDTSSELFHGWRKTWFQIYQFCLRNNTYRLFFVFIRYYRNLILQPLGIKYK